MHVVLCGPNCIFSLCIQRHVLQGVLMSKQAAVDVRWIQDQTMVYLTSGSQGLVQMMLYFCSSFSTGSTFFSFFAGLASFAATFSSVLSACQCPGGMNKTYQYSTSPPSLDVSDPQAPISRISHSHTFIRFRKASRWRRRTALAPALPLLAAAALASDSFLAAAALASDSFLAAAVASASFSAYGCTKEEIQSYQEKGCCEGCQKTVN